MIHIHVSLFTSPGGRMNYSLDAHTRAAFSLLAILGSMPFNITGYVAGIVVLIEVYFSLTTHTAIALVHKRYTAAYGCTRTAVISGVATYTHTDASLRMSGVDPTVFAYGSNLGIYLSEHTAMNAGVVYHELGHAMHNHIVKRSVMLYALYAMAATASSAIISLHTELFTTISLVLTIYILGVPLLQAVYERHLERVADAYAISNGHGDELVEFLQSASVADVEITGWKRVFAAHPTNADRIRASQLS